MTVPPFLDLRLMYSSTRLYACAGQWREGNVLVPGIAHLIFSTAALANRFTSSSRSSARSDEKPQCRPARYSGSGVDGHRDRRGEIGRRRG